MKYLALIWSGVWRKPGRTVLVLLQTAVAVLLFGVMQGMQSGIDEALNQIGADQYVVQRANGFGPMPVAMWERIAAVPGVKTVAGVGTLVGTYQQPSQRVVALAIRMESAAAAVPGIPLGADVLAAMKSNRIGALVSADLAAKYGWQQGDRIPLEGLPRMLQRDGSRDWVFDVVGIVVPSEEWLNSEFMLINFDYFNEARKNNVDTVDRYQILLADADNPLPVAQAIDRVFANSPEETRTESLRASVQDSMQSIGDMNFLIRAVVGAVLFALLFSIGASMMQSLRERTPEIAVLKAVGFGDGKIVTLLFMEALLLCCAAAALGLALAAVLLPIATESIGFTVHMPRAVLWMSLGIAVGLALAGSVLPAWSSLRLQVSEALSGR